MKECTWSARPYLPLRDAERGSVPYICRLAPGETDLTFQWFDKTYGCGHTVHWKKSDDTEWNCRTIERETEVLAGLTPDTEYTFYLSREDGSAVSKSRLFYTCKAHGTVVNYNHPNDGFYDYSGRYLSSPGILRLPSGKLLVSHDVFGSGPQQGLTILYTSADEGKSWQFLTEIYPLFWAKFFLVSGRLYTLGMLRQYGDLVISVSDDEGLTWQEPVTLLHGDNGKGAGMHQNATPVLIHAGRIYTGIECGAWDLWNDRAYGHMLLSAPADCDLLYKNNWEYTPMAFFDSAKAELPTAEFVTAIEGNAIAGPDGNVYNLLRMDPVNCERKTPINKAVLTRLVDFDHPLEFVDVVHPLVGIRHKFFVRQDPVTSLYFMVHNEEHEKNIGRRSCISLSVSADLRTWRKLATLVDTTETPRTGVSYPSFLIDGEDILYVSRSAFGKLKSEHDNNYVTFHRLENFRALL